MSHEITSNDMQEGRAQAWHGLTTIREQLALAGSWLTKWNVLKRPLFRVVDGVNIPSEYEEITCSDRPDIVIGGPVAPSYALVDNKAFVATVADALRELKGAQVETVGSVCNRARIFVTVKLAELESFKAAGREFRPFLNFLSSHDQSAPFTVNTSNICTVCNNTFGMNLRAALGQRSGIAAAKAGSAYGNVRVVLKHTKNIADRLENIPEIVSGFLGAQAEFRAMMESLAAQSIKVDDANALFAGFVDDTMGAPVKMSARRANQVTRLTTLFVKGAGNRGENLADVLSAGTDYYSHENAGDSSLARQFNSSEFGTGAMEKRRLANLLTVDDKRGAAVARGRELLALN